MTQKHKIQLFEEKKVRTVWDDQKEKWYFSVVDVCAVLSESENPQTYWRVLKNRLKKEGNETVTNCNALKGRGTGTCPDLKEAKSKRVGTDGCRSAFVCIFWQGLARQKILLFQNYFVSLQSEMEYLTSSKMTPKRSVGHPRKTAK